MKTALTVGGASFVFIALYLAFFVRTNHFYELLLLGLVLILIPLTPRITPGVAIRLYVAFLVVVLFGDLFIVLGFTHLWHYSYVSVLEYFLLYFFIYPAGGFVMLASYFIAYDYLTAEKRNAHVPQWVLWLMLAGLSIAVVCEIYFRNSLTFVVWGLLVTGTLALALGVLVTLFSERLHQRSYIRDFLSNPGGCLLATALATYPNLILHEYPNIFAREWIYTTTTGTVLDTAILGIPLLIWIGWPLLTIIPVSLFYLLEKRS